MKLMNKKEIKERADVCYAYIGHPTSHKGGGQLKQMHNGNVNSIADAIAQALDWEFGKRLGRRNKVQP